MSRWVLCLGVALGACGQEVDTAQHEAMLERLERIQTRLDDLERKAERATAEVHRDPSVVEVAEEATNRAMARERRLSVHLTSAGTYVGEDLLTADQLARRIEAAAKVHPEASLVLRADPDVEPARVADIVERAKAAGIDRIAVATLGDGS